MGLFEVWCTFLARSVVNWPIFARIKVHPPGSAPYERENGNAHGGNINTQRTNPKTLAPAAFVSLANILLRWI
jgi:hypothetical protein